MGPMEPLGANCERNLGNSWWNMDTSVQSYMDRIKTLLKSILILFSIILLAEKHLMKHKWLGIIQITMQMA